MGLSIQYNGEFKKGASLSSMIEEVKDVAELHNWEYHILEDSFDEQVFGKKEHNQDLFGICFTPPECETVFITFLSNGRMSNAMLLNLYGESKDEKEQEYLYINFVKTQYVGIEIHKLIIHLFKYLNEKYFMNFTMQDEGEYWETGDEKLLQKNFKRYTDLIDGFANATEIFPMEEGEDYVAYFSRLAKRIQKKRGS